ncbi:unnamed protein product [Adineta steineri]|uniref:Apple domain-containing protein n=1 Tax=Adineta steineri TaxID=433720 RepID=A0A814HIB0_9BILA|nr:unnamed protein product [Adineta steineri]
MRNIFILFLFGIIRQTTTENSHSLLLIKLNDVQYECDILDCSTPTIISVSNVQSCQFACLSDNNCRTFTFQQSTNLCKLFADIPSQFGSMVPQIGVITFTAVY